MAAPSGTASLIRNWPGIWLKIALLTLRLFQILSFQNQRRLRIGDCDRPLS